MKLILNNRKITLLASIIVLLFIFVPAIGFSTSRPAFCNLCHSMRTEAQALEGSVHKGIGCLSCHQEPGSIGYLKFAISGVSNLKSMVAKQGPLKASVSDKSCNRCHGDISEIVKTKDKISINHQHFNSQGFKCTDCHNSVAHGRLTANKNTPTIDKCLVCHNSKDAAQYPRLFQADKQDTTPWSLTHGKDTIKTHGLGGTKTCQGCHSKNFCTKCHKVEVPHLENFSYDHSQYKNSQSCLTCHKQSFCNDCHKIGMPHPNDWLSKHRKATNQFGESTCNNCHVKYECTECHERHIHPGQGMDGKPIRFF